MAALFGKKKGDKKDDTAVADAPVVEKEGKKEKEVKEVSVSTTVIDSRENIARVLMHPRITEKATLGTGSNVYVFDVAPESNKKQIKEAVKLVYNVEPVKVHVTKIAKKKTRSLRDGTKGTKGGGKKAYVYLKKGDSISVM